MNYLMEEKSELVIKKQNMYHVTLLVIPLLKKKIVL